MIDGPNDGSSRRAFLAKTAYLAPAILTLKVSLAWASVGSGRPADIDETPPDHDIPVGDPGEDNPPGHDDNGHDHGPPSDPPGHDDDKKNGGNKNKDKKNKQKA